MSCIVLNNNKESILHKELLSVYKGDVQKASNKYMEMQSDSFVKDFGDYKQYRDAEDVSQIDRSFSERLDDNFEPKIFNDEVGYYFINKFGREYLKTKDSKLFEMLGSESKTTRLIEIIAHDFIKRGAFNMNFDTLDFTGAVSKQSLNESLLLKLNEMFVESQESENMDYMINGYILSQISEDQEVRLELENKVKEYFKNKNIEYSEDFDENMTEEELDNNSNLRDPSFSTSSFQINTKDKVSANIKLRLSLMIDTTKVDNEFNQPVPLAFDDVYRKMSAILANNVALIDANGNTEDLFETFKNVISQNMGPKKIPYFTDIYNMMDGISKRVPKDANEKTLAYQLKAEIVRNFMNHSNVFNTTELKEVIETKKAESYYDEVAEDWVEVTPGYRRTKMSVEVFDASKTGKKSKDIISEWSFSVEDYFLTDNVNGNLNKSKKEELNQIIKDFKSVSNQPADVKLSFAIEKLNKIGISFPDSVLSFALTGLEHKSSVDVTDAYLDKKKTDLFEDTFKIFESFEVNKKTKSFVNTYMFKQLAEATMYYQEDGTEASTFTGGKNKFGFSNPSYLSVQIASWKKDRNQLLEFYDKSGRWTQGSRLLKHLLALDVANLDERIKTSNERLSAVELSHFNVLQTKVTKNNNTTTDWKDGKTISVQEYFVDTVNKFLYGKRKGEKSIFRTTTAPGKSTQFEISHGDFFVSNTGFNSQTGQTLISPQSIDVVYDYYIDEVEKMQEAFQELKDDKNITMYYHTDKDGNVGTYDKVENGKTIQVPLRTTKEYFESKEPTKKLGGNIFKSRVIPSLDLNLLNDDGFVDINKVNLQSSKIREHIKNNLSQKVDKTYEMLLDKNILEKVDENSFSSKLLDYKIFDVYRGKNLNATKNIAYQIAGDVFMNGLINHMEYSKMFAGDVAYYKNDVDYIKRISATYTDGVYQYLDNEHKEFNIGVVESVYIKEPFLDELAPLLKGDETLLDSWKEFINSADAQAWITPARWKSIMTTTAKWSPEHDIVFAKLEGTNKEPFTNAELKMVAQPVKGVYFDLQNGRPVYLKYSQAVLIPQLRKNTKLGEMYDYMQANKLDELLTFDAIKVGSPIPTKIHNDEGDMNFKNEDGTYKEIKKLTLQSKGWKLQQDLPVKTFKETDIGSQIQKNILLLINEHFDNPDKTFIFGNETFSAEEIIKLTDTTFGKLADIGMEDLYNEFNIDKDSGRIQKIEKFYKAIIEEYIKKGGNDETVKALRTNLSIYAIAGVKTKLDNIFASIVNDRTATFKTNGGSFIQMSNYGISKTEADTQYDGVRWSPKVEVGKTVKPYVYVKDANGKVVLDILGRPKIQPNQILISGSFIAKYVPNYAQYDDVELFVGKDGKPPIIDKRILENIIGYRIPNQGSSSNDSLEVVGILPEGVGDTVVAFTGITKKTGSDFDIDKMYIMFPNYKETDGKLEYIDSEGDSKQALQNKVIELYKSMLLHPDNIGKIMTPLDHEFIEKDAKNIVGVKEKQDLDTYDFIDDIMTKYSFMAGMAGVGQMANTAVDYAMGSISDYYLRDVNLGNNSNTMNDGTLTKFDSIMSQELSDNDLLDYVESYNKNAEKKITVKDVLRYRSIPISDTISALMNAFVDIAKDPYITKINWNMMTTNTGNLLIRGGVHPFRVTAFLAQPVIREYTDFVASYESKRKADQTRDTKRAFMIHKVGDMLKNNNLHLTTGEVINAKIVYDVITKEVDNLKGLSKNEFSNKRLKEIFENKLGISISKDSFLTDESYDYLRKEHGLYFNDKETSNAINGDLKNLRNNLESTTDAYQAMIFNSFLRFQAIAKNSMKPMVDASKHAVNGMGKDTTSLLMSLNRIANVGKKGVIGYNTKMSYKDGTPKLLGHYYRNLLKTKQIVQANPHLFVSSNEAIWNSYNLISNQIYNTSLENEDLGKKLEETFYTYLMSGFTPFNIELSEKELIINTLPKEFLKLKKQYTNDKGVNDYYILEQLTLKPGEIVDGKGRSYIATTNKDVSPEYTDRMINSWKQLLEDHPEFAEKLIQYSYFTTGFKQTTYGFFKFIPPGYYVENDFNGYVKGFSNELKDVDLQFVDQFYLSNLEDSQIVKFVDSSKINKDFKQFGAIQLNVFENDNLFIKNDKDYYKFIGLTNNMPVYSKYLKTETGYTKIRPINVRDKKGFNIYTINNRKLELEDSTLNPMVIKGLNNLHENAKHSTYTSPELETMDLETSEELRTVTNEPMFVEPITKPVEKTENVEKEIKFFNIGEKVIDKDYNVWKIISMEEYQKLSKVGMISGTKVRYITNIHPNEYQRKIQLNPDSTTYIKPNSINTLGENKKVKLYIETETKVKGSVSEVFNENPELAEIGTEQEYNKYLNNIFPDSKIKDIVYHGSKEKFDKVDINKSKFMKGFYFAKDKSIAEGYGKTISLIVNSKNINIQPFAHFGYSVDSKKEIETFLNKLKNLKKEKNLEDSLALQLIDVSEEIVFFDSLKEKQEFSQRNSGWNNVEDYFLEDMIQQQEKLLQNIKKNGEFDTMLTHNDDNELTLYAVGKPEQIHILGSKSDIEGFKKFKQTETVDNQPQSINIYAGSNENSDLSNFAIRPFTTTVETSSGPKEFKFESVEQAFHFNKAVIANNAKVGAEILKTSNGAKLRSLTNRNNLKLTPEQVVEWDSVSKSLMLNLMYDSYAQNPKEAQKLLNTGNAIITHTQDKSRWKNDFPEVVMTVRDMLREEGFNNQPQGQLDMFDEVETTFEEIQKRWEEGGYTQKNWNDMTQEEREHIIKNCL